MGFVIPAGIKEPFEKLPTGYIVFNIDKVTEGDLGKEGGSSLWVPGGSHCGGAERGHRHHQGGAVLFGDSPHR